MLPIPVSTDAPIYHYPIATVGTIILNVIMFLAFCSQRQYVPPIEFTEQEKEELLRMLEEEEANDPQNEGQFGRRRGLRRLVENAMKGDGSSNASGGVTDSIAPHLTLRFGYIRPWQWITNNFMHADWMHLIGNMIYLWAFGLIVEGKVGAIRFSIIYLGIGALYGCVLQVGGFIFGQYGFALGASAAIFGLLALCMLWAPVNEFTLWWFRYCFEAPVMFVAFSYVAIQIVFFAMGGFRMSSELLHLLGFAVGFPVGYYMITHGWVDCEGYDLISYMQGKMGRESTVGRKQLRAREKKQEAKLIAKQARTEPKQSVTPELRHQVEQAIREGQLDLAVKLQSKVSEANPGQGWRQADLMAIIQGYLTQKNYTAAIPLIESHIQLFDTHRFSLQTTYIKILLQAKRTAAAMQYMSGLNEAFLTPAEQATLRQLMAYAKKQGGIG